MTIFELSELSRADVEQYNICDERKQPYEYHYITLDYVKKGHDLYFNSIDLGKYLNAEIRSITAEKNKLIVYVVITDSTKALKNS